MTENEPFVDYYKILEVAWDCDSRALEYAYRRLAKLYHPDRPESADVRKLNDVIEAYRALRDPYARAEYDDIYAAKAENVASRSIPEQEDAPEDASALDDAKAHQTILGILYKRRRENAREPGIAQFSLQEALNCTDEVFDFHAWYLKARGFIEGTEQGTLAITIEGVDHVIATSRTRHAEKLRIAQSRDSQEPE